MNQLLSTYKDRYNKRISQFGIVMCVFGGVIVACNGRFIYNAVSGPFPARGLDLAAIKHPESTGKYYVMLQGQAMMPTDIAWVKVKKSDTSDSATVDADGKPIDGTTSRKLTENPENVLQMLLIDGYLLPVKMISPSKETAIVGQLEPLEPTIKTLLLDEAKSEKVRSRILAMQLTEDNSFKAIFWVFCASLGFFLGSGILKLLQVFVFWKDFERHPIGKAIAKAGNYNTTLVEIDDDFNSNGVDLPVSNAIIGKKWLLVLSKAPRLIALRDVVWSYVSSRKESTNFVTNTNYSTIICTSSGEEIGITLPTQGSTALVAAIAKMAPWANIGFDGKLALRWSAHKKDVIAEVQKRCDDMQRKS